MFTVGLNFWKYVHPLKSWFCYRVKRVCNLIKCEDPPSYQVPNSLKATGKMTNQMDLTYIPAVSDYRPGFSHPWTRSYLLLVQPIRLWSFQEFILGQANRIRSKINPSVNFILKDVPRTGAYIVYLSIYLKGQVWHPIFWYFRKKSFPFLSQFPCQPIK